MIKKIKITCTGTDNIPNRIGNAVMPKFMFHLAKHIKTNIL